MTRLNAVLSGACLLAVCLANGAGVASPATARTSGEVQMKLEDVDGAISNLRHMPWQLLESMGSPGPDESGRTMQDDVDQYLLTDEVLKKTQTLRDQLAAANPPGTSIPAATLEPLQQVMAAQACSAAAIAGYWRRWKVRNYHHELIAGLVLRLAPGDRPAANAELRSVEQTPPTLRAQVDPAVQFCQHVPLRDSIVDAQSVDPPPLLLNTKDALLGDLNALRQKIAARVDGQRDASLAMVTLRRSTRCPEYDGTVSPSERPKARSVPNVNSYYAPEARNMEVTGVVRLRLTYDATGCITEASVAASSGADLLDDAALHLGLEIVLTPGQKDGKPVAGRVIMPVRFNLFDWPGTAPDPPDQTHP